MAPNKTIFKRDIISWSLYDFANTIYSMNIVSRYLKLYIIEDLGYDDRYFDIPFALSMLLVLLILPALGAFSDHSSKKKMFLILFTVTCCLAVGLMSIVSAANILILLLLFIVANFTYEAAQPFYNALLYSVAEGAKARYISGLGVALGYVGSIFGMILVLPFVTGSMFSIDVPFLEGSGKTASFIPTAVLFLLFSLPIFFWVKEKKFKPSKKPNSTDKISIKKAYLEVWEGLSATKKYPGVLRFLIADYFFEDAAWTVILNIGLYCSLVIGFSEGNISLFLIISTISAVIGSLVIGKLATRFSLKKILRFIIYGWVLSLIFFVFSSSIVIIWILGSVIGILLGGLWTITRPYLAELVSQDDLGRFFGLFSLSGRAAAVIGPLIWTLTVYLFRPYRPLGSWLNQLLDIASADVEKTPYKVAVLVLALMMVIGLWIFKKVPDPRSVNYET